MRLALLLAGMLTLAALNFDAFTSRVYGQQPLSTHLGYHQKHFGNLPWSHYGYHGGCGNGYHGGYHHASTFEEGYLRGYADLVRSQGAYNYATSLARIKNEQARRLALENQLKATETHFELRRINRDARELARQSSIPRPSAEDIARFASDRAPEPLSSSDFDAAGRIDWPFALTTGTFADQRATIDALLARRAAEGASVDSELRQEVVQLEARLKSEIRTFSTDQYLAAKKFLAGLKQTDALPTTAARLVAR
ncbi:MAG: hypothetical protein RIC55_36625 [Pirellulaceae bacterium]